MAWRIGEHVVRGEIENQPPENMIEAMVRATVRLAKATGKATCGRTSLEAEEIVRGLKRARWSLRDAMENAGLAKHMGSADPQWLEGLRREFRELREQIRRLICFYDEETRRPRSITEVDSAKAPS